MVSPLTSGRRLRDQLLKTIQQSPHLWSHSQWKTWTRRIERYQIRRNRVLRLWHQSSKNMHAMGGLPIVAFKEAKICSFPTSHGIRWFESSGTTTAQNPIKSRHWFRSLDLYEASVIAGWKWFLEEENRQMTYGPLNFVGLMPSFREAPHSSLSCMLNILMKEFGDGEEFWCMKKNHWDWNGFYRHLVQLEKEKRASILFGTAFGWVHFLDWCASHHLKFCLPQGTWVMETGGYKGRSRILQRTDLYHQLSKLLGVKLYYIRSEYSMCELSSQAYSFPVKNQLNKFIFQFPPWCKYRVVHPGSSKTVSKGQKGVLEIQDLANLDSCAWIRTEDMAFEQGDGFELAGRLLRSGLKGCSLVFEED